MDKPNLQKPAKPPASPPLSTGSHPLLADRDASPKVPNVKAVCVYCGSGHGTHPDYKRAAIELGEALAASGLRLVYGGGGLGLMGEVARATLGAGGAVTGIIPDFLSQHEQMLEDVDELIVTKDMHERKALMFDRSDAFVALPGGIGTLEELVEQLTWAQLGRHNKPIVVVNVNGFWDPFLDLLSHMRDEAFIRPNLDVTFSIVSQPGDVITALGHQPITAEHPPSDAEIIDKF